MSAKLVPLRRLEGDIVELSDEAVLAACSTGDTAALGVLFDRFHRDVYRFVGRFPSTDELGRDDLVQTTFLEVRRTAHAFRGASSVRSWIFGIAANVVRHSSRGERRQRIRQAKYLEQPRAPLRAVDDQVEQRQLLARVQAAMAELPRDQQLVFILCDLEQIACTEVSKTLAIPEGTVWRRLHTARTAIRNAIEEGNR